MGGATSALIAPVLVHQASGLANLPVRENYGMSEQYSGCVTAGGYKESYCEGYGSAYTNTGGTIDPPQPVGNIAATIQAPNLSITSGGQIQNVGNVIGTSVTLTGQKLINGITTANT